MENRIIGIVFGHLFTVRASSLLVPRHILLGDVA